MTENHIPKIGWNYLVNDRERMWIAQGGEGSRTTGTMRYAVSVHYFLDPGGSILLPYVMAEIETVPGIREQGRDALEYHYFFFHGNGSGRFVASEHAAGQKQPRPVAEPQVHGYTMARIHDLLEKLPEQGLRRNVGSLSGRLSGCPAEEIAMLVQGEPTLAHRYNRDSIFYSHLRDRLGDDNMKTAEPGRFSFHQMLGRCLSSQLRQYL